MPSVPPGFPAILAPVFLIAPAFPGNLRIAEIHLDSGDGRGRRVLLD